MIWQFLKVKTECGENIALVSVKIKVIFLISKQCAQNIAFSNDLTVPPVMSDCNCIPADL